MGGIAGVLCSLDGLHLVQSRVAMLDIFLSTWVLAALWCLLHDRDRLRAEAAREQAAREQAAGERACAEEAEPVPDEEAAAQRRVVPARARRRGWGELRWWRIAAGVCLGAACATKWSGVYYLAVGGLASLGWELHARSQSRGLAQSLRASLRGAGASAFALGVVPVVVYIASWAGWFRSEIGWSRSWAAGRDSAWGVIPDSLRSLWHYHGEILQFHQGLSTEHTYQSHPLGWLLLDRPVAYYYASSPEVECAAKACSAEVLAIGLPMIWWVAILALGACLVRLARSLDEVSGVALVGVATSILVWIPSDLAERTMFSFYALPAVPFMCLAIAACCSWVVGGADASWGRRRVGMVLVGIYLGLVVANFLYFYPVLTGVALSYDAWRARMWRTSWI